MWLLSNRAQENTVADAVVINRTCKCSSAITVQGLSLSCLRPWIEGLPRVLLVPPLLSMLVHVIMWSGWLRLVLRGVKPQNKQAAQRQSICQVLEPPLKFKRLILLFIKASNAVRKNTFGFIGASRVLSKRPCQWNPWNHLKIRTVC